MRVNFNACGLAHHCCSDTIFIPFKSENIMVSTGVKTFSEHFQNHEFRIALNFEGSTIYIFRTIFAENIFFIIMNTFSSTSPKIDIIL